MRNVWLIFRRDAGNLFRNVMSAIITVGLVVLPSLFAWYNILACWDVFENTGNLSVAVASEDAGYESDLLPINVNIGEKVVSALRSNSQINWVFTDADDAVEGAKAGTYYAALVIPKDFSKDMLTFYEGDSVSATIDYYVNEKKNAIAPNITNTGADTVSYEVNETFAQTISEVAVALSKSLSQAAQDNDASAAVTQLAEHMRSVANRLDQSADVLGLYSSLADDSQGLVRNSVGIVESARNNAALAVSSIDEGKRKLSDLVGKLEVAANDLSGSLDRAKEAVVEIEAKADELIAGASSDASAVAQQLRARASDIDAKATELSEVKKKLEELRDALKNGADEQVKLEIEGARTSVELSTEVKVMYENTFILDKDIAALKKAIEVLQNARDSLTGAADNIDKGTVEAKAQVDALRQAVAEVQSSVDAAKADVEQSLKPGADKLKADIETLATDLDRAAAKMSAVGPDLTGAVDTAAEALGKASTKIDGARVKLNAAAKDLRGLADAVDEALASGDLDTLRTLLQGSAGDLAAALSAPVKVDRIALFPSDNFGSAMTPLYCTLALFIGSLLIMVAMKVEVSARGREQLRDPKPRHLYFGRFGVVSLVSFMQTTLLGLGTMLFLKVQVSDPWLFMVAFWISGLVFAFIIYTLVVAFGNLGKGIAVLLLIVQVTACGGSYPLQILPDFVQAISPWVPATYVVNALRAAMMGVYQGDFWIAMGRLLLFVVPFLLLGLVLRKPLERFMRFYVSKVEESKLME